MSILYAFLRRVISPACGYDRIQALFGAEQVRLILTPLLLETGGKAVLDVGAGTGLYRAAVPDAARYIWMDNDLQKWKGFRRKYPSSNAALGDATRICLSSNSVDFAMCVHMMHHLSDLGLALLFGELARVVREKIIFWDPLERPDSLFHRTLWKFDRGSFPRSETALLSAIEANFEVEYVERYKIFHYYLLCVARRKAH